jgi:hypothetical protein
MIKQLLIGLAFIFIAEALVMVIFDLNPAEMVEVLPWRRQLP